MSAIANNPRSRERSGSILIGMLNIPVLAVPASLQKTPFCLRAAAPRFQLSIRLSLSLQAKSGNAFQLLLIPGASEILFIPLALCSSLQLLLF
jgi:hypothetical protein